MQVRHKARGVTLVELMVVLVVVAVLGVVAVPSYRQYVMRAQRGEAKEALMRLASNQERWYLQNNTYTANLGDLGFPGGLTADGNYELVVNAADTQGFDATATPAAGSTMIADDDCQSFSIDEAGEQTAAPNTQGKCW